MGVFLAKQPTHVADEAELLALENTLVGDIAIRLDDGHAYMLMTDPSHVIDSWRKLDDANEASGEIVTTVVSDGVGIWGGQRTTPKFPTISSVVTSFASGHGWSGGADDTTVKRLGSQSYKLTAAKHTTNISYVQSGTISPAINLTTGTMEFMMQLESGSPGLLNFSVDVSSDGGTNWTSTETFMALRALESDEWVTPRLNKNSFNTSGSVNFSAINKIRVGARTSTSAAAAKRIWLQRLATYTTTETKASLTICVESYASVYTLAEEFIKRGIRPTLINRPGNVLSGANTSMTLAQLQELHTTFGFGVAPLQWSNTEITTSNYLTNSPDEFRDGLLKCLWFYKRYGFERPMLWYSSMVGNNGGSDAGVLPMARSYFETAISSTVNQSPLGVNVLPIRDPHALTGLFVYTAFPITAQYQSYIDRIIETKSHGVIYIVNLDEVGATNTVGRSDLQALLDYILAKGSTIEVLTANEFVRNRI